MCRSSKSGAAVNDVSLTRTTVVEHKQEKSRKEKRTENETEIEIVSKRLSKIENKKKLNEAGDIQILDKTIVKQSDEIRAQYQTILRE